MTMSDDLHRLTRPHAGTVHRDDGKTYHQADSLLNQLREAFAGLTGQGAGGGGTPAPISLNAYDIYRRIEAVSTHQYWATHDGGTRTTLEGKIQAWVRVASTNPNKAAEAEQFIRTWVREIEAYFRPPKPLTIGGPCPQCGYAHYLVLEDGEHIRKPTLIGHATTDTMWVACEYCQTRWEGDQLHNLIAALDTPAKELTQPR
jgi:hypothetical protein